MYVTTRGCSLPYDLVVLDVCVFGSLGITLLLTLGSIVFFGLLASLRRRIFGQKKAAFTREMTEDLKVANASDQMTRIARILIALAASDGDLHDKEAHVVSRVLRKIFGMELEPDEVRVIGAQFIDGFDFEAEISGQLSHWEYQSESALEALLKGMILVASADGVISPEEISAIKRVMGSLKIESSVIDEYIDVAIGEAATR